MKHALILLALGCGLSLSLAAATESASISISASVDDVKDGIAAILVPKGWSVDYNGAYKMTLRKPTTGGYSFATSLLLGNAHSEKPDEVLTFDLAPGRDSVTIVLRESLQVLFADGQTRDTFLKSKKIVDGEQSFLASLKRSVEERAGLIRLSPTETIRRRVSFGADFALDGSPLVKAVIKGSAADRAGILVGDLIVSIDGQPMDSFAAVVRYCNEQQPGDMIHIKVQRNDKMEDLAATLAAPR